MISIATTIGFLLGCGGESQKINTNEMSEENIIDQCVTGKARASKSSDVKSIDFGNGSDGEFYLANYDAFQLVEKEYNFTNVNLDQGSLLTIADDLSGSEGTIQINSLAFTRKIPVGVLHLGTSSHAF